MRVANHDTLVRRLALILVKLNQGEKLDPNQLALEFDVNLRTIQRDINERFGYLPLEKSQGKYFLNPAFLGKLSMRDVENFAKLTGVKGLFSSLGESFLQDFFDTRVQSTLLVKGHDYEDLSGKESIFKMLEQAIVRWKLVEFSYQKSADTKKYEVEPYRLLNNKGVWYLAAKHKGRLKTFLFSKLSDLRECGGDFVHDTAVDVYLKSEDGVWFSDQPLKVVLEVDKAAAPFFTRRKLIANQVIEKLLDDGRLILSAKVGHRNQVIPIVRYWIPHIRIISPSGLQDEMNAELRHYLSHVH